MSVARKQRVGNRRIIRAVLAADTEAHSRCDLVGECDQRLLNRRRIITERYQREVRANRSVAAQICSN
jgi:hypothetical protein